MAKLCLKMLCMMNQAYLLIFNKKMFFGEKNGYDENLGCED